jgi:uncharacterized membrane protein YeaQ/YmgE (transglycosylase-associated protein family)
MWHWIYLFLIGIVTGGIARFVLPGAQPMGLLKTGLLGVGGSLLTGLAFHFLGRSEAYGPAGFIGSIIGALVILFIGKKLHKPAA